jgi:hypothetical protein
MIANVFGAGCGYARIPSLHTIGTTVVGRVRDNYGSSADFH